MPLRVDSPALDAGSETLALTRPGRSSSVEYDMFGRTVKQIATDPDGIGSQEAPVTTHAYDAAGRLLSVTDPLDSVTAYAYDNLGRKTSETDAESGETSYTYDAAGRMASLTDPEDNTTTWSFDPLGRVATETINVSSTDLTRTFSYDARGNLVRKVDRNGRVLDYSLDSLSRQTTEKWCDNLTDADVPQNVRKTYSTTYDEASRVASIGDGDYDFDYTYSILGNLTSTTQDLTGLTDDVVFSYGHDVLGRKTYVAAVIGSTDDYVNAYSYDNLGRITQITQDGVSGGNAVAEKRVDFGYNDDGTRATISRFADLAGTKAVAETEQVFDELGRVTDIVHERAATEFADYDLTWDAAGRISDFDFDSLVGDDGDAAYSYDDTNQLTGSDYAADWQADESYVYDENGNRTLVDGSTSYTTGDHNRLTSDGTYSYTYDNEGNVLTKTNISTSESVEYTWDHRNRLTKVTFKNSGGTATEIVEYAYDDGQRWVRKTLDTDADGTIEESRMFVHDNGQIVLDFEKTGTAAASNSDLAHRYLWGNSVDQLLADETVVDGSEDDTAWALTDHLNSVRDLVVYNPVTGAVSVVKHVTFDAFGNVTSDSATGVESLFLYTARPFDADSESQNNLNRWYDATTGRWMSVDPIGYAGSKWNLYEYVQSCPTGNIDSTGESGWAVVGKIAKDLLVGTAGSLTASMITNALSQEGGFGAAAITDNYPSRIDAVGCPDKPVLCGKDCPKGPGSHRFVSGAYVSPWSDKVLLQGATQITWSIRKLSIKNVQILDGGSTNQFWGSSDQSTVHNYVIEIARGTDNDVECECCRGAATIDLEVGAVIFNDVMWPVSNTVRACFERIQLRGDSTSATVIAAYACKTFNV